MNVHYKKTSTTIAVLFIFSCGGDSGDSIAPDEDTPDIGATIDTTTADTGNAEVSPVTVGTAQYGYSISRPLTTAPPDDLTDYYNLYWFNPDSVDYTHSDEPYSIADIRYYADYETSFGFALRTLEETIHQSASEIYNIIGSGGIASDNDIENTLAVQFHQRLNNCSDVAFEGGHITSYSCDSSPAFIYHAPDGGKLLVELSYKNSNGFHLSIGNDENLHPGFGYGVWYSLSLQGSRVFAQHTYPGSEVWTVSTIPDSKVTGEIRRDTYLLQNMEIAVRGLLFNEYY